MADFKSFVETFRRQVGAFPQKPALVYCYGAGGGADEQTLTYAELDDAARARAVWLQANHKPGERALLLHPPGLEFVKTFLGCLYAGVIPAPAPPPNADRRQIERTMGIVVDANVSIVLTTVGLAETIREQLGGLQTPSQFQVMAFDDDCLPDAEAWVGPELAPESVAFLQYTSGSTSEPKGVMVTHRNLVGNLSAIQREGGTDHDSILVSWLPHFHDMGLVGALLHPLYAGATTVFMSPITFLKRPVRWLETISRWRATIALAPDFAYELCSRLIMPEQITHLDLSSLRWAVNGAEPVRATTLERFARRFEPAGFRYDMFAPCYGMAECTLLSTVCRPDSSPVLYSADPEALERHELRPASPDRCARLVGCGMATTMDVRIVDPRSLTDLEPRRVGEIWLRSASVAEGYWEKPDITAQMFGAYTADGDGPYLRTGDLGVLRDNELYITGRLKDILIVQGRNLYPQDVEFLVRETHPALTAGMGVVFAVSDDNREHMVVVQEVKKALLEGLSVEELAARTKIMIARSLDIPAPSVVLVNRGAVQRTTSGKVQRRLMRTLFLEDRLRPLHENLSAVVQAIRRKGVSASAVDAV